MANSFWTTVCTRAQQLLMGDRARGTKWYINIAENFNWLSTAHEC